MNWVLEQFERDQWIVVSRYSEKAAALRAQAVRQVSFKQQLRVREKPLA